MTEGNNNNNKKNGNSSDNNNNNNEKDDRSVAEVLVDLISENSNLFFKDQYEAPHARIHNGNRIENIRVESSKFKRHLIRLYYGSENRVANTEAVSSAVQLLQAKAEYEGQTYPLSIRVASHNGAFFYDLTNPRWESIQITKQGWQLVDNTPVPLFTRFNQTAQVQPSHDYEPDIFDRFMSLTNVKKEEDKKLVKVYIVSLFIPDIQHVILQTCGEKGGAKSMLEILIKELADPAKPKLLSVHKDRMEFIQQVAQNHLVFYDNIKYPPRWLSDESCRAVTGSGSSERKLYTDDDSVVYEYKRCLGFNGISLVLTEPDALDRSIIIEQERIDKKNRIPELVILSQFYDLRPRLLGYIFDILVKAMIIKPTIKLDGYPRMADFAEWGEAIARAMGYNEMDFIDILDTNTGKQNAEAIENSVLGQVITRFLNDLHNVDINSGFCYESTVSEFLVKLNDIASLNHINTNFRGWPKAANSLTKRLRAIASNIKDGLGFEISIIRNTAGKDRGVSSVKVWKIPAQPEHPRSGQNRAQNGGMFGCAGSEGLFRNLSGDPPVPPNPSPGPNEWSALAISEISVTDDLRPYVPLIETQYLPNLGLTAYRCKEHPRDSFHYDLENMVTDHFNRFHGGVSQ